MAEMFVRIPEERVAVLIGIGGATKKTIEEKSGAKLEIEAESGAVTVSAPDEKDPWGVMKARDVVVAVGRGFSPERAFRLFRGETYFAVLNVREVSGKRDKNAVRRIRSRLIGEHGKARERLEELSGCSISVYGYHVALIGSAEELERGTRALTMLLRGSEHSTVFGFLSGERERGQSLEFAQD